MKGGTIRRALAASMAAVASIIGGRNDALRVDALQDKPLHIPFNPAYRGTSRNRIPGPRGDRSQYDVLHPGRGISYAEHDRLVRSAMAERMDRPSWSVWHGWRPGDPKRDMKAWSARRAAA